MSEAPQNTQKAIFWPGQNLVNILIIFDAFIEIITLHCHWTHSYHQLVNTKNLSCHFTGEHTQFRIVFNVCNGVEHYTTQSQ